MIEREPLPVIPYRQPDVPYRARATAYRRGIRLLLAVYWLTLMFCVIWVLLCVSAMTATVVELSGFGPRWPWQERAQQLVAEVFFALPALVIFFLLRHSRRANRPRKWRPRGG